MVFNLQDSEITDEEKFFPMTLLSVFSVALLAIRTALLADSVKGFEQHCDLAFSRKQTSLCAILAERCQ